MARRAASTISSPTVRRARSTDPVTAYARSIADGAIACRQVRLACERHLRDLERAHARGYTFNVQRATRAIEFFSYLCHSKGEWAGLPLTLAPWQQFVIGSVFGWVRTADGQRRFRTMWLEVPRKSGKSTLAAGIGIYALVADEEPGAEVFAAATKRDQARIIFGEAQRMVRASPALSRRIGVFKLNLSVDATASKFEPLSSDERTLDGLNPSCLLIDELHKHRSRALLDVLDTAVGARRQPMLWMITTAGDDDPESVYAHENDYATKVLEGLVEDDRTFALIATIDPEDRWDDPEVWQKANLNLGISVKLDDLARQAAKAKASPPSQAAFKRLRLNVRQSSTENAVDMDLWKRNSLGPFDPAEMAGRRFFGGLDLSSKIALSAFVKLFPPIGDETRWRIDCRFWLPGDTVEESSDRDRVQYQRWIEAGWIEATEGNVIDHNEVATAIMEDCRYYSPISIAYDPWNATQLSQMLVQDGAPMIEFIQGVRSYNAPLKELLALLAAELLDHGDNPVLAWMAHNLRITLPDRNENVMPSKKHSTGRIDGMTGLIMGIGRSLLEDPQRYLDSFLDRPLAF